MLRQIFECNLFVGMALILAVSGSSLAWGDETENSLSQQLLDPIPIVVDGAFKSEDLRRAEYFMDFHHSAKISDLRLMLRFLRGGLELTNHEQPNVFERTVYRDPPNLVTRKGRNLDANFFAEAFYRCEWTESTCEISKCGYIYWGGRRVGKNREACKWSSIFLTERHLESILTGLANRNSRESKAVTGVELLKSAAATIIRPWFPPKLNFQVEKQVSEINPDRVYCDLEECYFEFYSVGFRWN